MFNINFFRITLFVQVTADGIAVDEFGLPKVPAHN